VLVKEDETGNKKLVGYVVGEDDFNKEEIISYLKSKLPEYMVPALWVEMDSFPLTSNGKIDRKALPDPDASEMLSNEYEAPGNETEKILADIWKELLHVERVGIHDNFFELGGDSIITIQVLSRARRLGYELKPNEIFIHQTIANLSKVMKERSESAVTGEQGLLSGRSGMLPIQQWYFENAGEDISYYNQSVLLSIDKSISEETLTKSFEKIMSQHDALRFRYFKEDDQWIQEYGDAKGELNTVDLMSVEKDSLGKLIKETADKFQQSLDIEKGELVKFVLIKTPESESHNRILMVIHHLAIDGVSWRIILDDLEILFTGLQNGTVPELGIKSSSYRQWFEALEEYSNSNRLLTQTGYWENAENAYEQLTTDKTYAGDVKAKDIETISMKLDAEKTELLLHEVPRVYHTEINDMLLCALALTICEWDRKASLVIGMEGHGRENINDEIDTSRTVGWLTNLYPVLLELKPGGDLAEAIKAVKEQLRLIPDKGLGYGVLKYINKEEKLSNKKCWDIIFNYLGQVDNIMSGKWLSGAAESNGASSSEDKTVKHLLEVNGAVQGGELVMNWGYSKLHYEKETISEIVESYKSTLQSLIDHCLDLHKTEGAVYTPSDYGLESDISLEELDNLLNKRINN
jgi:non-ribosomal peptide synthase protein (TIGR01720 family)